MASTVAFRGVALALIGMAGAVAQDGENYASQRAAIAGTWTAKGYLTMTFNLDGTADVGPLAKIWKYHFVDSTHIVAVGFKGHGFSQTFEVHLDGPSPYIKQNGVFWHHSPAPHLASETKGAVTSYSFSGTGDRAVFIFQLSSPTIKGRPDCNTTGRYVIHMNVRSGVFAASVIANAQNKLIWKETLSVLVSGAGTCSNGAKAEDAGVITINDGEQVVATYGVEPTKANDVPIDADYPLPPVVRVAQWPTRSPVIRNILEQFFHDYCYSAADVPSKWCTHRSQQSFAAKLLSTKIPFVSYVANGSMGGVCLVGSLFGRSFFDQRGWQTYAERIAGRTATVLWRNNNIGGVGGAVFYKEDDRWRIDFVFNFCLPGGMPAYAG